MLSVNKEIWLWRFVGIFSLALCTLNLSVLMHGHNIPIKAKSTSFVNKIYGQLENILLLMLSEKSLSPYTI